MSPDKNSTARGGIAEKIAYAVIRGRYLIILLFALLLVFSVLSVGKTKTDGDFSIFLPEGSETRRGSEIMRDEFKAYASARIMIANTSFEAADAIAAEIAGYDGVLSVSFDGTADRFRSSYALIGVGFAGESSDPAVIAAAEKIAALTEPFDCYIDTDAGVDYNNRLSSEMGGILLISSIVIFAVLTLTSNSYFEPVVYAAVFAAAALINMGTNYLLGTVSTISNSISVVMQLALAIDYSIIFMKRYHALSALDAPKEAACAALAGAIPEILSSGLTTVTGLAALTLMEFRLGYDLGTVLTKGIVCSMLTVILLMPGITILCSRPLAAAVHRPLIPSFDRLGRGICRSRHVFTILFALLVPAGIILSNHAEFAFSSEAVDAIVYSDEAVAAKKINSVFPRSTYTAVLIPAGDYEREKALIEELRSVEGAQTVTGLAGIDAGSGYRLTDTVDPHGFAAVTGVPYEQALLIYAGYRIERGGAAAPGGTTDSRVPLIDLLEYIYEKTDAGAAGSFGADLDRIRGPIRAATDQLRGREHDRIIVTTSLPAEGEESVVFAEKLREAADAAYGEGASLIIGDVTLSRDLRETHVRDTVIVGTLTAVFVFLILLAAFRTPVGAAILVFVIQSCVWLNFSFPALTGTRSFFVTYMIVSAIQMGATVDYAIIIMNRYLKFREELGKLGAAAKALAESFPTVVTSGSILGAAGLLIGYRVSDVYVGHIGLAVGRGAIISVIIVTAALPGLMILFDGAIRKTTFRIRRPAGKGRTEPVKGE